jgi:hypothetical protein
VAAAGKTALAEGSAAAPSLRQVDRCSLRQQAARLLSAEAAESRAQQQLERPEGQELWR